MGTESLRNKLGRAWLIIILFCAFSSCMYSARWRVNYDTLWVDTSGWHKRVYNQWSRNVDNGVLVLLSAVEYHNSYIISMYASNREPRVRLLRYDKDTKQCTLMPQPPLSFTGMIVRNDSLMLTIPGDDPDMLWNPHSLDWQVLRDKCAEILYEDNEWYVYTPAAHYDEWQTLCADTKTIFRDKSTGEEFEYPPMLYLKRWHGEFVCLYGRAVVVIADPRANKMVESYRAPFTEFYVNEKVVTPEEMRNDPNAHIIAPFVIGKKQYLLMSLPGGMQVCRLTRGRQKEAVAINANYSAFRFHNSFYYLRANNLHMDEVWTELHDYSSETYAFLSINGYNINLTTIQYR